MLRFSMLRLGALALALALAAVCVSSAALAQESSAAGTNKESEGRIYGALVLSKPGEASNTSDDSEPVNPGTDATTFEKMVPRLGKAFPAFQKFELLGEHRQSLFKQYETWVVPSRDLFLKIDSKGPAEGGGMKLHLQVWRDDEVILKTDPVLMPGRPLFIGGPNWRDGKLVIVVALEGATK